MTLKNRNRQAASEAYGQYQLMHNPYVDPQRGYYAFIYGKIGFIVLDLRRYRSKRNGILFGKEQWDWLEDWLKNQGKQCEVIIIACSVPFIHLTNHIMRIGKQWLGKFLVKIFDIEDDLVDQWGSAPFIKDAQRFAELLFDLANSEGIRFVLLGGDVHVATFAVLRSYEQKHEYHPVIYQFTSSPISNRPAKVVKALMTIAPEIELSPNIPFKGRLLKVIAKRNFGIVEIQKHRTTGDYSITFELRYQDDKSVKAERFPTQW